MKVFQADWVCPVTDEPIRDGVVVVEGEKILEVGGTAPAGMPVESFRGCALIPGFVNAHIHLELTILRGFLEDLSFQTWIRRLTRAKYEHLSGEELLVSARLGALECLGAGVTAVGEVMDLGTGWDAMVETGLRGVAFQEVFGPQEEVAPEALRGLAQKVSALRKDETATRRVGVSPHAPFTVSAPLFESVRDLSALEQLPLTVHVAESREETQFVRDGSGPFAAHWNSRKIPVVTRGATPIQYLDDLGVFSSRTLAIHAIEADSADIATLGARGSAVAHCPKSNLKLGHGVAPVAEFVDAGIPVGLGTDSVASNNVVDMFEEMRAAIFLQRTRKNDPVAIGAQLALRMATLDAARCLGLEEHLGSLEEGKLADIVVVDLNDPALRPVYDPVETMVYSASRKNVIATFLGGERVEIDPADTITQAQAIADRLKGLNLEAE